MRKLSFDINTTLFNDRIALNNNMNYQRTFCLPFQ